MFQVNDYVICGGNGVCKIKDICSNPFNGSKKDEKFYILKPVYCKENTVYIPIHHPKITMRKLISKEEAKKLIQSIPSLGTVWIDNDKQREIQYKSILQQLDCYELVKMIKTLYLRNKKRVAAGKKITSTDQKYFKLAEKTLHEELAVVLDIPEKEVENYIGEQVEQAETN